MFALGRERTIEQDPAFALRILVDIAIRALSPLAAPLDQCAQLLGVDLATLRSVAADVEPYLRIDGTKVWSLMQLERRLRPNAYGRVRGGYLSRRRTKTTRALRSGSAPAWPRWPRR